MTALPAWIDKEAWAGYVDTRRAMKKPMTARAELLILKELFALKANGQDPNAALDQSALHGWVDVYPVKDKEVPNLIRTETQREAPMTPEEKERADAARRKVMNMVNGTIKLVKAA
jgi:hypothetical protein